MNDYLQCDPRWGSKTYDGVNTFCKFGCLVVSLSNLLKQSPIDVAKTLKDNGLFTNGYINDSQKAAQVLGLEYNGVSHSRPNYPTIAETNYFAPKNPQHFFVINPDGSQLDPLGKSIKYPIVSYRLFRRKENMAGQLYNDSNGNVWISYNGKKFYVEAPQDFTGEKLINGDPPGVVMIKQSDSETLVKEALAGVQGQIKDIQIALTVAEKQRDDKQQEVARLMTENKQIRDDCEMVVADTKDKINAENKVKVDSLEKALRNCEEKMEPKQSWFSVLVENIIKHLRK